VTVDDWYSLHTHSMKSQNLYRIVAGLITGLHSVVFDFAKSCTPCRSSNTIEMRWCPACKVVRGNEKADDWAKLTADELDSPRSGMAAVCRRVRKTANAPPQIPCHLKRENLEGSHDVGGFTAAGKTAGKGVPET